MAASKQRARHRAAQHDGLDPATIDVLIAAVAHGDAGVTVTALTELTGINRSTVSHSAKTLTERRMLCSKPDPADGRSKLFRTTTRGTTAAARALRSA